MMNKKLLVAVLMLITGTAYAQDNWTLKGCIEYGLKNHRSNVVYANEKKAADAKAREALAAYLPGVSIQGSIDDNLKVQETVIPAGIFGDQDIRVAFTKKFNTNPMAQLDQTIFDQSLLTGLKANKYNKESAELNVQQNNETIIYNISSAFAQIFVYREQLAILHTNLDNYHEQMDITRLQVDKGTVLQKELDKVRVDYNNTVSKIHVAESNLTLSYNQLKYEMGYPLTDTIKVDSTEAARSFNGLAIATPDARTFEAASRVDYRISQVNEKLYAIDEQRLRNGIYPRLTAYARYGAIGYGNSLNESFKSLATYSAIGIKLNIPILDFYKRNAQSAQAKYKHLNAIEQLKIDEGKYAMEFQNAWTKVIQEQGNMDNNRRNIELAQSVFNTTNLQYQKGTTDMTDWLNAQNSLKEAQNNYLSSVYNFFLARIDLEKAGGSLKTFYLAL
ncbi:TolC family protein [Chitinophaga sancti]|uniref:Outer membrane protein TolC n=1 Tax=Chitinophaga sancti TaxID=1004 RepID=A0A1K1S4I0_9BACT|nr:TolC family protein [Chitinophaga sancti]WQD63749.1 TolC family protein [Chitinophaga sancti]WQG90626.1 TolC family protein [Chitinophaga sancti]SFW79090.1 Outer membrane protein TolC [Chitinophaga sancti]